MNRIQVPIYELNNIKVVRDNVVNLKVKNFKFHRGAIYGIVGPIGAGKSTLLSILGGQLVPNEGSVEYESEEFKKNWRGKIKLPNDILCLDDEPIKFKGTVAEYVKNILPNKVDDIYQYFYSSAKITTPWDGLVSNLSSGQIEKLKLITSMEADPKVLLMDDYGINFDPQIKKELDRRLKKSVRSRGTTVVLSNSELSKVKDLVSVVIFLDNGHISKVRSLKRPRK
ncbi:MAG: ATP-binding cassette domain-containing protein [Candidatus Marinimicrobia bacterium]|jgi:ABC-2 type transport system ATP-binding protein|nr:ATP-binding cassette domain-containing protein [Candidatus Neomarinimicrobiota bacterium]MDP6568216.1 ATP-binding cassette domain-containing protein [Candidatus Neomarinimicrobiota bacterium]MDP7025490.1 ATP-binding cassette domain-containing protein [Candidatus Neomarinimicrobiota bacterium]|tara:strand:- start:395 stop:1072 length:678 start_codon:yes stop_codon:yes gene_type:complete